MPLPVCPPETGDTRDLLHATADVVEPMGNETLISCRTGSSSLTIRTDPASGIKMGDTIGLRVNLKKAHFFDSETEQRIEPEKP